MQCNTLLIFRFLQVGIENLFWSLRVHYNNAYIGPELAEEDWLHLIVNSKRRYNRIVIADKLHWRAKDLEVYIKHGAHVKEVVLQSCVIDDHIGFIDFLKAFPNLKKLFLHETSTMGTFNEIHENQIPNCTKLETLELVKCQYEVLKSLEKSLVTTLKVLGSMDNIEQKLEPLLEYLSTQTKLTTLALRSINQNESHLFKTAIPEENISFQLKKISLLGIRLRESPNDYNNLLKFLKKHANTIEELELGKAFPEFVYEFIISKFKNLKSLRIFAGGLSTEPAFYERLETNLSVRKLIIVDSPGNDAALKGLFERFPNVEELKFLVTLSRSIVESGGNHFKKLRHLSLRTFNGEIFNGLRFPALEVLKTFEVNGPVKWEEFTKNHSSLVELNIHSVFGDFLNIEDLTKNLKLKSLTLLSGINGNKEFFDVIRKNCKELKMLEIDSEALELPIAQVSDIRGLRFQKELSHFIPYQRAKDGEFWSARDYSTSLPLDINDDDQEQNFFELLDPFEMDLLREVLGLEEYTDDEDSYDDDPNDDYDDDYEDFYPSD